jgi:hypothetical protein
MSRDHTGGRGTPCRRKRTRHAAAIAEPDSLGVAGRVATGFLAALGAGMVIGLTTAACRPRWGNSVSRTGEIQGFFREFCGLVTLGAA